MRKENEEFCRDTLMDILACGVIIGFDSDFDIIVTANGSYINTYALNGRPIDCQSREKDFYNTTAAELLDEGTKYIAQLHKDFQEEEE